MAKITNFGTLKTEVANWLNRDDLTSEIPGFVQNAEAQFQRRFPDVTSLSADGDTNWLLTSHPDVYLYGALLEATPFLVDDERIPLWQGLFDNRVAAVVRPDSSSGLDNFGELKAALADWLKNQQIATAIPWFVEMAEAKFNRRWRDVTALSADGDTNWLLTSHPDVYLYGALLEAAPYLQDDERSVLWVEKYEQAASQVRYTDADANLTTYAGLQAMVSDYLEDPRLDTRIPHFISLAEAKFRRDLRLRKVATATFSISSDDIALPTDFRSLISWYFDGSNYYGPIEIVDPDTLGTMKGMYGPTGVPRYAALINDTARFAPAPDATYSTKMVYEQELTALSAGVNWLLTDHPDVYLYGALVEAEPYLRNDARAETWKIMLEEAIQQVHLDRWNEENGGTLKIQHRRMGV